MMDQLVDFILTQGSGMNGSRLAYVLEIATGKKALRFALNKGLESL